MCMGKAGAVPLNAFICALSLAIMCCCMVTNKASKQAQANTTNTNPLRLYFRQLWQLQTWICERYMALIAYEDKLRQCEGMVAEKSKQYSFSSIFYYY